MPSDYNLEKMSTKTREKVNRVASELLDGKSNPEALEAAGYSSKITSGPTAHLVTDRRHLRC